MARLEGGGDAPTVAVIVEFPDRPSAEAWYRDAEYQPWIALRQSGSHGDVFLFDGL